MYVLLLMCMPITTAVRQGNAQEQLIIYEGCILHPLCEDLGNMLANKTQCGAADDTWIGQTVWCVCDVAIGLD